MALAAHRSDSRRNRRRILDAASSAFAERGLAAHVAEVALAAGVGVGTVYRHFPTKRDLIVAVVDERYAALAACAREALADPDAWRGFCALSRAVARATTEDRALCEAAQRLPDLCAASAGRAGLDDLFFEVIERAQVSGALRDDLTAAEIAAIVSTPRGVPARRAGRVEIDWQRHTDVVIAGLRRPEHTVRAPGPTRVAESRGG